MNWVLSHTWNIIFAVFMAFLGYFAPVAPVVHVVCAAIFIDLFTGVWAARVKGKGIQSLKLWRTINKLLLSIVIIMLLFAMDKEIGTPSFQLHRIVAWFITGFEVWSILENAATISNHRVFVLLKKYMHDKIEKETGVDIKEKERGEWKRPN